MERRPGEPDRRRRSRARRAPATSRRTCSRRSAWRRSAAASFTAAGGRAERARGSSIIGYGLWQRRYAGDPSIVGRTIQIDGAPYEVVGVMPADFVLPTDFQNPAPSALWMPTQWDSASTDHGSHGYYAAARLKPGATVAQARDELHAHRAGAGPPRASIRRRWGSTRVVLSLRDEVVGRRPPRDLAAVRRGRVPAAHRLRQRRQPAARARGGAPARDGRAHRARRRAPRASSGSC